MGCCDVDPDIALQVLISAVKYMVPTFEEPCRKILIDNLSSQTIWEVYSYSVTFGDDVLRKGCREYFWKNEMLLKEALASPHFHSIPYDALLDLLQLNDIQLELPWEELKLGILISEKELFIACHAWAVEECKRQNVQISGPNKRKVLGKCLKLINFRSISANDITNIVLPTEILNEKEKTSLIVHSVAISMKQAEDKCPSSRQCFPVDIKQVIEQRLVRAVNKNEQCPNLPGGGYDRRSSLHVTPKKRLILSQVWLEPRPHFRNGRCKESHFSKYQVDIKHKHRIKSRQVVVAKVIGTVEDPVLLLVDIEPFVLEANIQYMVRVEHKSFHNDDTQFPMHKERLESFLSEVRLPHDSALAVSVTGTETNECIVGFTMTLG